MATRIVKTVILLLFATGAIVCTPDDDERCDDAYQWDGENCVETSEEPNSDAGLVDAREDREIETDAGDDAERDNERSTPDGLGTPCTQGGGECDGFEASYCTANPMAPEGYCTITDCSSAEGDCPDGYRCCEMTVGTPPIVFCATEADFETMSGIGLCES